MTGASEHPNLQGGIIAAGHGTRLRADGSAVSKPMARVGGRPLIDHTLDRFRAVGIRRVTVVINEASDDCRQWLNEHGQDFDLDLIVRTTPSSYASFQLVADRLTAAPAVITTVDSIMPVDDFRLFVKSASGFAKDAVVLGLTSHVDDDNPLWATLDLADGCVQRLGGDGGTHVTAGLYWLPARKIEKPTTGFARLRDYLRWLADGREQVYGVVLPLVFDIDRARDVEAAELAGIRSPTRERRRMSAAMTCWGVYREAAHSPGRIDDDAAILQSVGAVLAERGFGVELVEADALTETPSANVFVMCERGTILDRLAAMEKAGSIVVNSPAAIRNTYRHRMIELFAQRRVSAPLSSDRRHRCDKAAAGRLYVGQALRFPRDAA